MSLSKCTSDSSSEIGYNEDLITSIFLHLPVKSVLRCKCVCKHWRSIASNPQFCRQHASLHGLSPKPSALLFERSYQNSSDYEFCFLPGNDNNLSTTKIVSFGYLNAPGNLFLLSSCNGLLLFLSVSTDSPCIRTYYVCNPTTKKFTTLAIPNYVTFRRDVDASLAFDPRVSPHYKVIFLWGNPNHLYHYRIAVYSSETKACKKLGASFVAARVKLMKRSGTFCNGRIHWHVDSGDTSVYFDVEKECLNSFPLPPWYRLCQPIRCFGESSGHLHAILLCQHNPDVCADVYELKDDYSGWDVKHQIGFQLNGLWLSYIREELEDGSTLVHLVSDKIIAYNLKEKTIKKVCDLSPLSNDRYQHQYRFNWLYEDYSWCSAAYKWIETLSCV